MTSFQFLRSRRALFVVSLFAFAAFPADGRTVERDTPFQRELSARIETMLRQREARSKFRATRPPAIASQEGAATTWVMPVQGVSREDLVDTFGAPRNGGRRHQGIDIFAERGTPAKAVTNGVIAAVRQTPSGGRCVYMISATGYTFYYAHLDRWAAGLFEGQSIRQGQIIGYVGNSGNAAGSSCHLHFEIQEEGRTRNPYLLLQRRTRDEERLRASQVTASTR